jgi:anthraniloyl-CoA monooxygenase
LLASFLSPLTNIRKDEFGGNIQNRIKFPLQVFQAMREVFTENKPMSVRVSASDWAENGITEDEIVFVCEAFKNAGADIINVSTGNTVAHQQPQIGRMWQTPFSDLIRNSAHIPTITTGYIQDIDQINTILLNGLPIWSRSEGRCCSIQTLYDTHKLTSNTSPPIFQTNTLLGLRISIHCTLHKGQR